MYYLAVALCLRHRRLYYFHSISVWAVAIPKKGRGSRSCGKVKIGGRVHHKGEVLKKYSVEKSKTIRDLRKRGGSVRPNNNM